MLNTILLSSFLMISPVQMERPCLVLAQGYVESRLNPYAIGKKKEKGAFQVRKKYWGKVPRDSRMQIKQYEYIMNIILSENKGCIKTAIRKYNGKGKAARKYYCLVRQKALEIALI